jgi:CBS domain-containing protein
MGDEMSVEDEAVRTLTRRPPVVVAPESTLRAVAEVLAEDSIGVVVARGDRPFGAPGSRAEGVVSERDIVRALAEGMDPDTTTAGDVMTPDLAIAAPSEPVSAVAKLMLDNEIRHVPLVPDGIVAGVVSERDLLRAFTSERTTSASRARTEST